VDEGEMRRLVAEGRVARLGTIDDRGRAHLVPFVYVLDGDTIYTGVDRKPKRSTRLKRLANLRADPRATLLVDHYEEDWTRAWWVRVRGRARILEDGPERDHAARLLAEKYPQYEGDPPDDIVIAIGADDWYGWAFTEDGERPPAPG